MKRLTAIGVTILIVSSIVSADMVIYTDRSAWESAVSAFGYQEETFDDGVIAPDISVVSNTTWSGSGGSIEDATGTNMTGKVWWDQPTSQNQHTTWSFATPLVGWGAYWDLAGPGGAGAGLQIYRNSTDLVGEIAGTVEGEFWGFVSFSNPFDTIRVTLGTGSGAETHEMDNMVYSVVPVPGAVLLGMLGLGAAGIKLRKHA